MARVYPAGKMIPPCAFAPRFHFGITPGRYRVPSPRFPGWVECGYSPGERREIKRRHNRRSRRHLGRLLAETVSDVLKGGG